MNEIIFYLFCAIIDGTEQFIKRLISTVFLHRLPNMDLNALFKHP